MRQKGPVSEAFLWVCWRVGGTGQPAQRLASSSQVPQVGVTPTSPWAPVFHPRNSLTGVLASDSWFSHRVSCVTCRKWLSLSEPGFPHLESRVVGRI